MLLRRAYSLGLVLYPADFRAQFGGEMVAVFEQAAAQRRAVEPRASFCSLSRRWQASRRALQENAYHTMTRSQWTTISRSRRMWPGPKGRWRSYRDGSSMRLPSTTLPTLAITINWTESYAPYSPSCARSRVDGAGGRDYQKNKG